jgi:crotonobetainyl-CoA:carnitine CoA-transferase CaiB-like acyl-CoA transferase
VVEVANYISGPLAAQHLGDLGAEVVKVEPPGRGDPMRSFGRRHRGTGVIFANLNRNKRSVQLDLKTEGGTAALRGLLREADVMICNWRPGVADSLGLADADLEELNGRLVRCYVTGFGPDGPHAARPAFDGLLQAMSGMAAIQGRGGRPTLVDTLLADKLTAAFAAQAILAGLHGRSSTGRGVRIDVAMLDVIGSFLWPDSFASRTIPGDTAGDAGAAARDTVCATADGYIVVSPVSGAQITRVCEALGHPEWKAQLRAIVDPTEMANALLDRIESATETMTTAECLEILVAADVPAAPVLDLDGHLGDPQVRHNGSFTTMEGDLLGIQRTARYPGRFAGTTLPLRPPPVAGESDGSAWRVPEQGEQP